MNPLFKTTKKGTLGELIVQLQLLEHGVQAAPPIKDSGNDLIAILGSAFRAVQVRTTCCNYISKPKVEVRYHILAVVRLPKRDGRFSTREAEVFLFDKRRVAKLSRRLSDYRERLITHDLIAKLFKPNPKGNADEVAGVVDRPLATVVEPEPEMAGLPGTA